MKHVWRMRSLTATATTLIALLAFSLPASAEQPAAAPSPAGNDTSAQCLEAAESPALGTPEPMPRFGAACSENGTEVYICIDSDSCGCSSGHCAFLAYEYYSFGQYRRSCFPEVQKCTYSCTFDLPCSELCAI